MSQIDTTPAYRAAGRRMTVRPFLLRLHFYLGLFVGPFIFVAALTGLLFVITPQIEERLYADALFTDSEGPAHSLAEQAEAARAYLADDLDVSAVRPATAPGGTTRIMFSDPALGPSENRTVFIDPVTLSVRGDMTTYGTSGILPLRITLDYLHRSMMLGDWGRYYSELAASWLWVVVLGGVVLWATGPKRRRSLRDTPPAQRRRWIHATLGMALSVVLLLVSVTGLTWSQGGGGRIDAFRDVVGWTTPAVSLDLDGPAATAEGHHDHADHAADHPPDVREDRISRIDAVAFAARMGGIDSPMMEIRLPKPGQAWMVREYDRSWPTQVDTIALHPETLEIISRADFESFTIIPKLIRWGIDAHMGILFGLPNQIVMAVIAIGLMVTIVYGYRMWWVRRPAESAPLMESWRNMPVAHRLISLAAAAGLGWALPMMGLSLVLFLAFDVLRWRLATKPA